MFGFLKELVAAAKEGIDEAKQEFAEEQAVAAERTRVEQEAYAASLVAQVASTSAEERFAVALGAVYRETFLQELKAAREQQRPAGYLHIPGFPPEEIDSMEKLLRRDFDAHDAPSVATGVGWFAASLDPEIYPSADAVAITRGCWLATAADGLGLLEHDDALRLTEPLAHRARLAFSGWAEFGQEFLAGERTLSSSNPIGRRALARTVDDLLSAPGSPWHDQPWPPRPEPSA